ncbi:uncharacterized protein LOC110235289 [Exaiptasia diaphana]|uniref:Transposase n=1 Tax=Exaiptasia diaphana TaxID=2652724 RepID=A0A913WZ85_EXADI|nr:uncharacterized protein LOC110235289 [Exaiptasia diaphana]
MPRTTSCRCNERSYLHAHCFCSIYGCEGKAVSRSTYHHHQKADQQPLLTQSENETHFNSENESTADTSISASIGDDVEWEVDYVNTNRENDQESDTSLDVSCDRFVQTDKQNWDTKVVDAILNALPMKQSQGDSIKSFEDWLRWAKDFVITDQELKDIWPTSWTETEDILRRVGYESPKHYYICMNDDEHHREWDIMEHPSDKCRYCGQPGDIDYYYLGLTQKIKRWFSNKEMCSNMLDHWREKEHWYYSCARGETRGWPIKKELWDGTRFSEYSWFFDATKRYLLPTLCPYCKDCQINTVISAEMIAACDGFDNGSSVKIICHQCRKIFTHIPTFTKGDPRNIVYIAHWDGFTPFETTGGHSTGVLDVKIGNIAKRKRNHTDQVYVVGFVPSSKTPDDTPGFLDPFLTPLINEIVEGFINGIEVNYSADFPDLNIESGTVVVRHLIMLWTGDHPGQCEVAKFKRTGKKACRRCHICGKQAEEGSPHYYYGGCRYHARYKWPRRTMEESLHHMKEAEEETGAAWKRISKESGFTGLSKLTVLYYLYGFDVLHDTVIDLMHGLPMNPVKKHLQRLLQRKDINFAEIESRLSIFPWTPELKASRYPTGFTSRLGYWKAEDYQKFAFPASEVILSGAIPDEDFLCWKLLVQMIQMVFSCCRNTGWTYEDIELFGKVAWRHNIISEETFGLAACVITEHNLLHVTEDIYRFSAPDNFWVFDLERAVKRYVNQSTNHKNIEKTYSNNEVRREVLQNLHIGRHAKDSPILTEDELETAKWAKQVSSLKQGNYLILHALPNTINGIAVGSCSKKSGFHNITQQQQEDVWEDVTHNESIQFEISKLSNITKSCKSILKPGKEPIGPHVHCRVGENAMFSLDGNQEKVGRINRIHSITVKDVNEREHVVLYLEAQLYQQAINDSGLQKYYQGTESKCLHLSASIKMINSACLLRKVILYPAQDSHEYILIDFEAPKLPTHKQFVAVPFYPERNDMVVVQGENDEEWLGRIISVQKDEKKVGVHFFKEHPRWVGSKKYIKESSIAHYVDWDCITKKVNGSWLTNGLWQLNDTFN